MIKNNLKIKILVSLCMIFLSLVNIGFSKDRGVSWDFSNCEVKDILFALSVDTGISIVPDDTVSGYGDFQFSGGNFSEAFDSFLTKSRLYVSKNENIWTVSKFRLEIINNIYYLDCYDLYPYEIFEKITEKVEWYITYDNLPEEQYSVHFKGLTKEQLVSGLGKYFGNFNIISMENGFHFEAQNNTDYFESFDNSIEITVNDKLKTYYVDAKESAFFQIIEKLFTTGKFYGDDYNYCILSNNDNKVYRTVFHGENFEKTLNTICYQNGYKAVLVNNVYYIITDADSKEKLIEGLRNWYKFPLSYITTDELFPLLNKKLGNLETIPLLDKNSFICNCTENEKILIEKFILEFDIKRAVHVINLKYLKPQEVLEFLPPDIVQNNLFVADNNSQLYFRGTDDAYKNILEQINIIDKPVKRISYDLLIIQCDENSQKIWSSSIGAKRLKRGEISNVSAILGSVMGFNLNVVGAFGLNFAAELQSSIEENSTRVYADTTLHGVSGKKISFQNTNTYRYRDNNIDPENGKPIYSGITKEIVTGIKIDVLGWVSGDGMITSTVTASISRQGIDTSGSTGNPPPTTEKLITTEVTGKSGEPVVLSGLLLAADTESEKRSPFISKLPLIGHLFKSENTTKENSQMIIYLVPHVIGEDIVDYENHYSDEWYEDKIRKIIERT